MANPLLRYLLPKYIGNFFCKFVCLFSHLFIFVAYYNSNILYLSPQKRTPRKRKTKAEKEAEEEAEESGTTSTTPKTKKRKTTTTKKEPKTPKTPKRPKKHVPTLQPQIPGNIYYLFNFVFISN
jgi:hypothetical protein